MASPSLPPWRHPLHDVTPSVTSATTPTLSWVCGDRIISVKVLAAILFPGFGSRVETECGGTRKRSGGEVKGKKASGRGSQQSCPVSDTVYPALLPLMCILRLLAADWTDTTADKNGIVYFAERKNLVSARVPPHSVFTLHPLLATTTHYYSNRKETKWKQNITAPQVTATYLDSRRSFVARSWW